ncbi:RdRP-domain-containing protein [Acephala macrosclerotiorum]|nr:RdRP-domain-containing protein [Acephala macrosclerotiorum]
MDSIESVQPTITKLVNAEYDRMLNKRDEQRCRILIPKSRLLFGICDAWDVLKEGECAVKITMDGDGQPRALKGMEILVTRNPCLHPGDLQKFKVVERDELAHLVDCIVFPTRGRRPAADLMSGGDLDGDTCKCSTPESYILRFEAINSALIVFVCWDSDLVPDRLSQPAQYPGAKEPVMFKAITDDDRLEYFARYTNASLGRVKNLFLDWARLKGPMSAECQQLNRLFSTCVDGNRIKVPSILESPPQPPPNAPPFILDILHDAAKGLVQARQDSNHNYDGYSFDAMELLLSRDDVAMSEFELVKLTYRWCQKNNTALMDFMHLFDVNLLAAEEKAWTLNQLPPSAEVPSLIMNALCRSNLIQDSELCPFKLDYPGLRWKRIYDSSQDRLATFLDTTARALELFHRKLIVIRVDYRLTLAIYVPQKIERRQECQVDDRVRLFAFPHSQDGQTSHRLNMPTKMNYRLYCDGNVFQLFERARSNSWIYIVKSPSDDSGYRSQETISGWRKGRQGTIDSGLNYDCRASIALDKFSRGLQRHIGRVNRSGVLGAVSSNLDRAYCMDIWLTTR